MFKVTAQIEIDADSYKKILDGTHLLNAQINFERMQQGKNPVVIHEDYYIRSALFAYYEQLENEMKTENFN